MKIKTYLRNKISAGVAASIVYTLATLFSRGMAIITTPIFTRIMPPDQIGVVNLYQSWLSMISIFSTLALTSGGFQLALKEFKGARNQYVSSILSLTSIVALALAAVYFAFSSFWNEITGLSTSLMILMLVYLLLSPAQDFWLLRQRYEYRYKAAGLFTFATALLSGLMAVLAVLQASEREVQALGNVRLFATYSVYIVCSLVLWVYIVLKGRTF